MSADKDRCGCRSDCGSGLKRREFLKTLAVGAAASLAPGAPVMAGPFQASDFEKLVPADKKLDPAWVRSLFARGTRAVYRGADLEKIGMPVGGICAGQLYLGGDGKLWHWDIFNQTLGTGDDHYAHPPKPASPLEQGFAVRVTANGKDTPEKLQVRPLDRSGFAEVTFRGEYPIGLVEYRDPGCPVAVSLEAFSPFIPLDAENSSLPATVLRFTVKNTGTDEAVVELAGWLENAVCLNSGVAGTDRHENRIVRRPDMTLLGASAAPGTLSVREDVLFDDFQKETYEGWEVTGAAFGKGPILRSQIPAYQGDVGGKGRRVVNSHASAPGAGVGEKDDQIGTLTSRPFVVQRNFITFWIGGGRHPGKTCLNLLVDGKVVRTATGHDSNQMRRESFDVREIQGKTARFEIVDKQTGSWGNIGIGEIVFTDRPSAKLIEQPGFGTMVLALLEPAEDRGAACVEGKRLPEAAFPAGNAAADRTEPFGEKLIGSLARKFVLAAGQEGHATFVIAWHFPNLALKDGGRFYATRFSSATAVAEHVAANFPALAKQTRLWRDTWYDSTLPYWFLDRTMLNTSILATSTCHWFRTGRFYGWEGVGCCEGTCTHVWHYAHAVARLFPSLERDLRRRTDFAAAMDPKTGVINHRGEGAGLAVDGQAGCILRAYREHQMSADPAFLKALWPKIKLAMQCLVRMDAGDGLLTGPQHNTLDQPWFGKVAWLSSLYAASARACEEMAGEVGDAAFAGQMREIFRRSTWSIDKELFNGEYYFQVSDARHLKSVGSHNGCEIDQVFGQSWAYQVGLGRILSETHVKKALQSLWRYNFTPDVGPYRKAHQPGRWYAMAGEAGLLMCSWPKGEGARVREGFDFYFNECMTGFEYQVAGHMLWENMVLEGLAIARAIHDRYHPARRNPWNEVECGDHYARAMASYGVFLAACGYEYHGPKRHIGFAPRLSPEDFRAAFTAAEGWGRFRQTRSAGTQTDAVEVQWGKLRVRSLSLALGENAKPQSVHVKAGNAELACKHAARDGKVTIELASEIVLNAGQKLEVLIATV
ncbi:MAG: GH116 family glycosyl-hydrolase [Thermoguttaceae bacterium]